MTSVRQLRFNTQKRKTRSHLAECDSFKTRQFCQPILVRPIQCVNSVKRVSFTLSRASRRPSALVHEHSQVLCYVRTHQIRHLLVVGSPSNRRGAISQCLLVYSFHIACFSSSLSRHGPLHPFRCTQQILTLVCTAPPTSARFNSCALFGTSCSGVWDPRSVEINLANLQCCCGTFPDHVLGSQG